MQTMRHPLVRLAVLGTAIGLSACGGGGGGVDTPPVEVGVPASAQADGAALVRYGVGLATDDGGEPFDVSGLRLPTSETDEPETL